MTWSPSFRPSSISIVLTELRPSFTVRALGLAAVRRQHKHADRLLCLSKGRPADFQNILESFELDRSVNTQIRTSTRRQRTDQRCVDLKRAFASGRIDARNLTLDQTVARVDDDRLTDAHVLDLRFSNSQNSFQRCRIGNARDVEFQASLAGLRSPGLAAERRRFPLALSTRQLPGVAVRQARVTGADVKSPHSTALSSTSR